MLTVPKHPQRRQNELRVSGDDTPCIVCGKGIKADRWKYIVHMFWGDTLVTEEEAAELHAEGEGDGDMYSFPLGSECYRNYPEIRPYAQKGIKRRTTILVDELEIVKE